MANEYPHLEALGLIVRPRPYPHVRWKDLVRRLDQWRYGFAYRYGGHGDTPIITEHGPPADEAEWIIADMAKGKCWHLPRPEKVVKMKRRFSDRPREAVSA